MSACQTLAGTASGRQPVDAPGAAGAPWVDLQTLNCNAQRWSTQELLHRVLREQIVGRVALVSAFGAESAVLLHLVSTIDKHTPVLFVDTGQLFEETLRYRDTLVAHLDLREVRSIQPDAAQLIASDRDRTLYARDADTCCSLRKQQPLQRALAGFEGWISGRKRYQASTRAAMELFEFEPLPAQATTPHTQVAERGRLPGNGRIKINPLAYWSEAQLRDHLQRHALPEHPLVAAGYASIGCAPCTSPVAPDEHPRAGRWRHCEQKLECGIHFDQGRVERVVYESQA